MATGVNYFWQKSDLFPNLPLSLSHGAGFPQMYVDHNVFVNVPADSNCFKLMDHGGSQMKMFQEDCNNQYVPRMCSIQYGSPGIGSTVVVPDYQRDTIICGMLPTPDPASKLVPNASQPVLMCPGEKARYICAAGGINVLKTNPTKSTFEVKCNEDQSYDEPTTWPECTDKLDCSIPPLPLTMEYDWLDSVGITPPFSLTYNCKFPNKKILLTQELEKDISDNMEDTLTVTCNLNGTYDLNIEDFSCTRPCPFPSLPDPELMMHDWTDNETKPEIGQSVKHSCLHGKQLVTKKAFEAGETSVYLDELMSLCTVAGWLNETIGGYTCTKDCEEPTYYNETFTYDWDESVGTLIGAKVK